MRGSLQLPFQTTVTEGIYSYLLRGTRTEKKRTLPSAKHWRKLSPVKGLLWNSPHVACETPDQAPSRATIVAYCVLGFLGVGPGGSTPRSAVWGVQPRSGCCPSARCPRAG